MESGKTVLPPELRRGRLLRGLRGSSPGGGSGPGEARARSAPLPAPRTGHAPARLRRMPSGAQFAEAFYFMVMASEMRDRAKALGRRYGLDALEMRAEIVRYMERILSGLPSSDAGGEPAPREPRADRQGASE
jgi:hypothetical protein